MIVSPWYSLLIATILLSCQQIVSLQGKIKDCIRISKTSLSSQKAWSYAKPSEESSPSTEVKGAKMSKFVHPQVFKMFQRANELMKAGDNIVAKKLLKRCLELHPFDSHSWLALARLEAKTGHLDSAKLTFELAASRCPENVHILHGWGQFEQKHGTLEQARECYAKAREIDPLNAYVAHALALLEQRLGNHDVSYDILRDVAAKKPTSVICVALAEQERRRGNAVLARQLLLDGLQSCTTERSQIYLALSWLEENVFRDVKMALTYIDAALKEDNFKNVKSYVAKASLELRLNQVQSAKLTLQTATKISSNTAQAYTMWSTIELESGNIDRARQIIEEGSKRCPGDQFLLQRWGSFEAKFGNITKARELFDRSVLIQPHAPTFVAWAIMEEEEGQKVLKHSASQSNLKFLSTVTSLSEDSEDDAGEEESGDYVLSRELELASSPALFVAQQLNVARELFNIGMEVDPLHGPLYHAYGNMELRRGNITAARSILWKGILNNCTDMASVYHALGLLEIKAGNIATARKILQTGVSVALTANGMVTIQSKPEVNYAEFLLNLVEAQTVSSPTQYSSSPYNQELYGGVPFILHTLGMLEYDCGQYSVAKQIFEVGNKLYPNQTQILLGMALVLMKMNDNKMAKQYFKASITADNKHSHAWQAWAVFEKSQQNYEVARTLFSEGLKNTPTHAALWQAFAVMEFQLGNFDVARNLLRESIARCPDHPQSYQAWACLEVKCRNFAAASSLVYEGMRRCSGSHAALWTIAALIEDRQHNPHNAKQILTRAIEKFPSHGALYKMYGEIEEKDGNIVEARNWFSRAFDKDPYYATAYHSAALLEARMGNLENLSQLHNSAKRLFNHTQATGKYYPFSSTVLQNGREDQWQKDQVVFDRIHELQKAAQHDVAEQSAAAADNKSNRGQGNTAGASGAAGRPSRKEIMTQQDASNQEAFIEELVRS